MHRDRHDASQGGGWCFCLAKLVGSVVNVAPRTPFILFWVFRQAERLSSIIRRRINFHLNDRVMFAPRHVLVPLFEMSGRPARFETDILSSDNW